MFRTLVSVLLLPPALNVIAIATGWLLLRWWRKAALILIAAGLSSLWLLATPLFSSMLHESIEQYPALEPDTLVPLSPQAIVVLGSGHYDHAAEFAHRSTPTASGLTRLHYAAYLHRQTGVPLLLTGGPMNRAQDVHSQVLDQALEVYGISARWREERSATTW